MRQALSHLQQASDALKVNRLRAVAPQAQQKGELSETESYLIVVRHNVEQALRLTNTVIVF